MTLLLTTPAAAHPWDTVTLGEGYGVPVAIGGDLTPEAVLEAHHRGLFCLPRADPDDIADNEATYGPDVRAGDIPLLTGAGNPYAVLWWSPPTRYVIPVEDVAIGRTLRRTIRSCDWTTSVDADFEGVLDACREAREPRWITDPLSDCLRVLHRAGWIRSIEVWDGDQLIGGLFGYALNRVFVMASAFHRKPDAAKVAIADLARRSAAGNIELLDAEIRTEYTVRLGARGIPRDDYLRFLTPVDAAAGTLAGGRESVQRLLESTPHISPN